MRKWLSESKELHPRFVGDFASFPAQPVPYDAIINLIGSGSPAKTAQMGASILEITLKFDKLILDYLTDYPSCRYIFFSSGAAYGSGFEDPVSDHTFARIPINNIQSTDWYGLSKLHAEYRHRSIPKMGIVDVRVFNYFSSLSDINSRFLITDILYSIKNNLILTTTKENIVRDYIGPSEVAQLVRQILLSSHQNVAVDFFSKATIDKISMLEIMKKEFGLNYQMLAGYKSLNSTGAKMNYYSNSRLAQSIFGYSPQYSSQEVIIEQSRLFLKSHLLI